MMANDPVLGLKLDSERGSVRRDRDKGKKGYKFSSQKWAGVISFLPSLIGANFPVATSLVIWVCLGS